MKPFLNSDGQVVYLPKDGTADSHITLHNLIEIDQETANSIIVTPSILNKPNFFGFVDEMKSILGGVVGLNEFMKAYPAFILELQTGNVDDAKLLLSDAVTKKALTKKTQTALLDSMVDNNLLVK